MKINTKRILPAMLAFVAAAGTAFSAPPLKPEFPPIQKLNYAEQIIEKFYVDTVNSNDIVEAGIVAMLKKLDPHSTYTNPEETRELTEPLQGNFSGIGIQFNMLNDTLYVVQTVPGGPSEKVGLLAGDRILSANDTIISGVKKKNTDIQKILRGPKGSVVNVNVLRKGAKGPIEFRIVRDDIPIASVDASFMAAPGVGYIRVSRFGESTFDEVRKALAELAGKGMRDVIVDLEDNGGGYLKAAYDLAGLFLDAGDTVVFTKGVRVEPFYYRTVADGPMNRGRVVVMVNQFSASASEILAGAMQDNDRGVVVGRRTFGKGLVQRPFPFPDGSMIRLTTQRYYTPSGRSIQKPYVAGEEDSYEHELIDRLQHGEYTNADSVHFADSLRYETLRLRRPVYGGGGIMPDRFVAVDTTKYSDYYRDIVAKGLLNQSCVNYIDENRKALRKKYRTEDSFVEQFTVTPEMLDGLRALGEKEGVKFDQEQYDRSLPVIQTIMKALIGRDLFTQSTYFRIANVLNPVYGEAVRIITTPAEYDAVLSPQSSGAGNR
ncbi:MAG TPA: peptidase S41 [Porphyromonadaceae bacterium]|jgi:carboxyl-terminal processing protease|nr:S41 family peptidase [Paramuribaculum sp.]HAB40868.1 peptidase S41 [Porphyromonadaceae bacterium]